MIWVVPRGLLLHKQLPFSAIGPRQHPRHSHHCPSFMKRRFSIAKSCVQAFFNPLSKSRYGPCMNFKSIQGPGIHGLHFVRSIPESILCSRTSISSDKNQHLRSKPAESYVKLKRNSCSASSCQKDSKLEQTPAALSVGYPKLQPITAHQAANRAGVEI